MGNNADNVSVGKPMVTGGINVAPAGTDLPKDAVTALTEAFKCLGYISEDGVTNTIKTDSNQVKAWGGDAVNTTQTSRDESYKFTMIEANVEALEQAYGKGNVTKDETTEAITVKHNGLERASYVYVIETIMDESKVKRIIIPKGKVTELGDVVYNGSDPVGYEVTVSAMPDSAGNTAYEYIAKVSA